MHLAAAAPVGLTLWGAELGVELGAELGAELGVGVWSVCTGVAALRVAVR